MSDPSKVELGAHIATWRAWKREQRRIWWEANRGRIARKALECMAPLINEQRKQPYLLERFLRRA